MLLCPLNAEFPNVLQMIFGCMLPTRLTLYLEIWAYATIPGAGAAYGTAKAGIGIAGVGIYRPDLIMKVKNISTTHECSISC